jgi:hypothetical protein
LSSNKHRRTSCILDSDILEMLSSCSRHPGSRDGPHLVRFGMPRSPYERLLRGRRAVERVEEQRGVGERQGVLGPIRMREPHVLAEHPDRPGVLEDGVVAVVVGVAPIVRSMADVIWWMVSEKVRNVVRSPE